LDRILKRRTFAAASVLFFALGVAGAQAQTSSRPVTLVAPFSAGGDSDLAARNVAMAAAPILGRQVIVLNKVGASGAIGSQFVREAKPDGDTLLLARVGSQAVLPALKPSTPYKWNDFTFLGLLELNPYVCAVRADSPYKSLADLIEGIKQNPGKLNYSTAGVGTIHEMGPQMLFDALKLGKDAALQIPYKGGGEASGALIGGQVNFQCTNLATIQSFHKSGQARILVVTTPERYREIPDVPTARELGYAFLERITGWSALYGPPGMDKELVAKWGEVLQKVARDPQWISSTEKIGSVPRILSPEQTAEFAREQFETYDRLAKSLGLELK
jgi:tripartite-type tricarboxylate transporter receptor subunit TctC